MAGWLAGWLAGWKIVAQFSSFVNPLYCFICEKFTQTL